MCACASLQSELQESFGKKTGKTLFDFSRGIDTRSIPFELVASRKSVNVEVNWGVRFSEKDKVSSPFRAPLRVLLLLIAMIWGV
jgi:hypothetical protein